MRKFTNMNAIVIFTLLLGCTLGAEPNFFSKTSYQSTAEKENYILFGEKAEEGEFPYVVSIQPSTTREHKCVGTILTKNWVLTSATCCKAIGYADVCAGSNSRTSGGTVHRIHIKAIHENSDPGNTFKNDICVVRVKDDLEFGEKVQKVTLPPQNYSVNVGDVGVMPGWGYNLWSSDRPEMLQVERTLEVRPQKECSARTPLFHDSLMCAVSTKPGQSTSSGDSGAPLLINGVQVGINSYVRLIRGYQPDYFAKVPLFIDWIKEVLEEEASELQFAQ